MAARIRTHLATGERVVAIVSARAGVTDRLVGTLRAPVDPGRVERTLGWLRARHRGSGPVFDREIARLERGFRWERRGSSPSPAHTDTVLAAGERLSLAWVVPELRAAGIPAVPLDAARAGLWTDGRHGRGTIDLLRSRRALVPRLRELLGRGELPVLPGFFGRGPHGEDVTLGRGGSDYSASAVGALLEARYVELVKADASILSADPRIVRAPRPVGSLSYSEAEELAESGARVLHPLSIEPARGAGLELRVVSLRRPEERTVIGPGRAPPEVRVISLSAPLRLWRLRFPGGRGRSGVLAEVGGRLAAARVPVLQAFTSAAVVALVVEPARGRTAAKALAALVAERSGRLEGPEEVALVTIVGRGAPRALREVGADLLGRLEGVSATRASVTLAVPSAKAAATVRELHRRLVEVRPRPRATGFSSPNGRRRSARGTA